MTSRATAIYTTWLLGLLCLCLFADQNLMAPNLSQIAKEFGFTDAERDEKLGGEISQAFWLLGGAVTLLIGYLTDTGSRKRLLAIVAMIGSVPCFLTGFVQSYEQLYWMRALTGIGVGGVLPLVYSMLADLHPPDRRGAAAGGIALAMGGGIAVGQLIAGFIGPSHGWRMPFIVVAIPAMLIALLFVLTTREPRRGQSEQSVASGEGDGHYHGKFQWKDLRLIFTTRTNLFIFITSLIATVPWGVVFTFLNDFYSQDKGFPVESATLIVIGAGAAAVLGGFAGGLLGGRLYRHSPHLMPLLCGATTLLGVAPMFWLINYPAQHGVTNPSVMPPLLIGALGGFLMTMAAANLRTMLMNVNLPESRGSVFAFYNLADDLGKGLGPVVIVQMIHLLGGRTQAFTGAVLMWAAAALLMFVLIRTFPRDEEIQHCLVKREVSTAGV
jgi:predicted MFS family arabinose efflux permease